MAKLDELRERLRRGETLIEPSRQHEVVPEHDAPVDVAQLLEEMAEESRRQVAVDLTMEPCYATFNETKTTSQAWIDVTDLVLPSTPKGMQISLRAEVSVLCRSMAASRAYVRLWDDDVESVCTEYVVENKMFGGKSNKWVCEFATKARKLKIQLRYESKGIGEASIKNGQLEIKPLT